MWACGRVEMDTSIQRAEADTGTTTWMDKLSLFTFTDTLNGSWVFYSVLLWVRS